MNRTAARLLPAFALVVALAIPVEFFAAAAFSPSYDWVGNTISDLGVTSCAEICSPRHLWMNAAMVISGLAMLGLAACGVRALVRAMWAVTGVSTIATGLIPLDVDMEWHVIVSTPLFLTMPLAVLFWAGHLRGAVAVAGHVVGAVSLAAGTWFILIVDSLAYGGLLERVAIWPPSLWIVWAALAVVPDPRVRDSAYYTA